ncbi:MAG: hypothetical protein MI702_05825, partial [Chlorobiales bacterium]|nr:hypothetical protein [Chlorobiales bacterium]
MAANMLNSKTAIEMSIFLVRAFVKLRETISQHKELARKINQLEHKLTDHDGQIQILIQAIRQLINP